MEKIVVLYPSCHESAHMEQYRSGHNGHDWKSCVPQKGTEGSNPSCSAIKKNLTEWVRFFFIMQAGFDHLNAALHWSVV